MQVSEDEISSDDYDDRESSRVIAFDRGFRFCLKIDPAKNEEDVEDVEEETKKNQSEQKSFLVKARFVVDIARNKERVFINDNGSSSSSSKNSSCCTDDDDDDDDADDRAFGLGSYECSSAAGADAAGLLEARVEISKDRFRELVIARMSERDKQNAHAITFELIECAVKSTETEVGKSDWKRVEVLAEQKRSITRDRVSVICLFKRCDRTGEMIRKFVSPF